MDIKPIKTEVDYEAALKEIEGLFGAQPDTPEGDRLEVLVMLVEAYEKQHYAIPLPDPIEAIIYHMERLGLSRRDLEPYIGSRSRVSEVLNRKRPLTLRMIRNLEAGLDIPAAILVQKYDLDVAQVTTHSDATVVLFEEWEPERPRAINKESPSFWLRVLNTKQITKWYGMEMQGPKAESRWATLVDQQRAGLTVESGRGPDEAIQEDHCPINTFAYQADAVLLYERITQ